MEFNEESLKKFNDYLVGYSSHLQEEVEQIELSIKRETVLQHLKSTRDARELLKYGDVLASIDPTMADYINIVQFFYDNAAEDADQVHEAVDSIYQSQTFTNDSNNLDDENRMKEDLEVESRKVEAIIGGKEYDFLHLVSLLEQSSLSDDEQIDVLIREAYNSCVQEKSKDEEAASEQIEIIDISSETSDYEKGLDAVDKPSESNDVDSELLISMKSKYNDMKKQINEMIDRNYHFIEGKTDKEIELAKNLANFVREARRENNGSIDESFSYPEERIITALFELIGTRDAISEELNSKEENPNFEEEMDYYFTEVGTIIGEINEAEEDLKKGKKEENPLPSKIIYFLDSDKPLFDITQYDLEDRKKIMSLIEKLENGIGKSDGKLNHTVVKTDKKTDYSMYVIRTSNMACNYIRVDDKNALILDFAPITEIYDNAQRIVSKYDSNIKQTIKAIKDKDNSVIEASAKFSVQLQQQDIVVKGA